MKSGLLGLILRVLGLAREDARDQRDRDRAKAKAKTAGEIASEAERRARDLRRGP